MREAEHAFMLLNGHGVTTETETTTHYIWSIVTNPSPENGVSKVLFEQIYTTIKEDEAVLESQQRRISEIPDVRFAAIASDGAVK